jgi:hypothetical protein
MRGEPPFGGTEPCPACPTDARNLGACAHNLLVNLGSQRMFQKLVGLRDAVAIYAGVARPLACAELEELLAAAEELTTGRFLTSRDCLSRLSRAVDGWQRVAMVHFADPLHAFGRVS